MYNFITMTMFLNHLFGKIICWLVGAHDPDWTYAMMTGSKPICRQCGRVLG